jgi:hypothetical protein
MITYMLETENQELVGYYTTLHSAKREAFNLGVPLRSAIITKLSGKEFGQGFHVYKLKYNLTANTWKYIFKR